METVRCANCGGVNDTEFSNFCSICAGKVFLGEPMTTYSQKAESEPTVKELLELSTLYQGLITDLAELWEVELTSASRARAFQVIVDFGELLKMKTLASAVLADIQQKENNNENS